MSDIFRGAFVMRSQDHNILTSTYFNNGEQDPYPETAKRIANGKNPDDPFDGTFDVIWLEKIDSGCMTLNIAKMQGKPYCYTLSWIHGNKLVWSGEAVKENGILFGYYWGV